MQPSDEDRFFAAAYLQHLGNDSDAQRKATLEARMMRMDQQLESQGL